jgi:hypothetical protein
MMAWLLAAAGPAVAQAPGPAGFWAALEDARTRAEIAAVVAPSELEPPVAESLRLLRQYELEPVRNTAYRARWELQRAVARRPNDPWNQLALALVLRRGPDAHVRNSEPKTYYFVDPRSLASAGALRALRRALVLDPSLELAAVELARFAVERHDAALLAEAAAALARVEPSAEVLLQRAAIALERRDARAALENAAAAARAGADAGRVAHARAVALLLHPATQRMGAAAYVGGLEGASEAAVEEYHRVAAPVFTRAEVDAWETLAAERRASWLRELWELRAALSGVTLEERLGVHFRRLYTAHAEFPLFRPLFDADLTGGLAVMLGEDVRRHGLSAPGLMLTRYGDPARLRWVGLCGTDNIPYLRPRGQERPGFAESAMPTAGVLDGFLPPGATRPVDMLDVLQADDYERLRNVDCRNPTSVRHFAQWITDGDRYRPQFGVGLPVQLEVYAFRGVAGVDVIAGLALPRREVGALADATGAIALHAAFAFIDTAARRTTRTEQVLRFQLPAEGSHVLLAVSASTTLHGRLEVRATMADSARRAGSVLRLTHDVPDFSAGLQLSDLVITPMESADRFRRGAITLALAAGRKYARGETFNLYYEIYGLAQDARYRTRIVVAPHAAPLWRAVRQVTGREQDVVALQFEERAGSQGGYGVQQLRSIGTSSLRPGTYRVQIEITDIASGRGIVRERLLDIHP